jgi:ABC-type glycerol-3-phosphate transport system substrate-binding protein
MKVNTPRKYRLRWLTLLSSALAGLPLANATAEVTTVEIVHYFNSADQVPTLEQAQKDFEAANPDVKLHYTYIPFAELVSRTLQMAAVHKPPGIVALDNRRLAGCKSRRSQGHLRRSR